MRQTIFLALSVFTALLFGSCSTDNNGNTTVVPLAPTALTATVQSTTQVNLAWTDNATNETGYKIERKTGVASYVVVGTTGADVTAFNDLNLIPNTSYTYRVYAYNSAGNSLQYSNEVTVTTQDTIPAWLANGLVGYWPFNGNANDESGNGNNGTVNGASLTVDRFGHGNKAYDFQSSPSYIILPEISPELGTPNTSATYCMWFRGAPSSSSNTVGVIMAALIPPYDYQIRFEVARSIGGLTGLGTKVYYRCPLENNEPFNINSYNTSNWHNITVTIDGTLGVYNYYFDGLLEPSMSFVFNGSNNYYNANRVWQIGAINPPPNSSSHQFFGQIDDIRIYNRALTQSEISYLASH